MVRSRIVPESNYYGFYNRGKTMRCQIDPSKPILPLNPPEIEDVAINNLCHAKCSFCYVSAEKSGQNFPNIVDKIHDHYGNLPKEHRPFQVAMGGAGEPTLHPDLIPAMEAFHSLGITPNYTTNGMHLSAELLEATRRLGSSVGVSCHPHLDKIWRATILRLEEYEIKTALHIIVGDPGSAARYYRIMKEFPNVMYYLALPYIPIGRAKPIPVEKEWDELFAGELPRNAALGAHFYPYLMARPNLVAHHQVSIHEPEVVSGYRMLDDSYRVIRKSSFDPTPKERNTFNV